MTDSTNATLPAGPEGFAQLPLLVQRAVDSLGEWMGEFGAYEPHPTLALPMERVQSGTDELLARLRDNYPFFHPRYAGQMLKPPHPIAMAGYISAMLINPNNHALDGGPATAALEKEVVAQLAAMFGYRNHLGHLTSSGTIANLEALFIARETHPGKAIAHSAESHYTHSRMCHVLGVESIAVPVTIDGTMDLAALEDLLKQGRIGTIVATAGTTGLGAIDPIHEIVRLATEHGARVHVDAAYGGFFRLIADDSNSGVAAAPFAAIADADSVVIDPHKHGLQPYGCGAVLFRDPSVAKHFLHDSPYTYFTSDELHLGEISLECSRAGAAAAALWLTLKMLPLTPEGFGAALRPGRRAALAWADLIAASEEFTVFQRPQLDIVSFFPTKASLSAIDTASDAVMHRGMELPPADAVFLATYAAKASNFAERGHEVTADADVARIIRSVVMKPENESSIADLHARTTALLTG